MTDESKPLPSRFRDSQQHRTLWHPMLLQPSDSNRLDAISVSTTTLSKNVTEKERTRPKHSFVVCADPQLGMTSSNQEWETELAYSRQAVKLINSLQPRPLFCTMCGDISDMESSFYVGHETFATKQDCDRIQNQQYTDFQTVYTNLHPDIALVCLCGNHDIGNRPTAASIERFTNHFGNDYLAFWVNGTYNIVLNTTLFSNHSAEGAQALYNQQLEWLHERLEYAKAHDAANIFVFGHHPWFLYSEEERNEDFTGISPGVGPRKGVGEGVPDSYFPIPLEHRREVMQLFRDYGVSAAFSGHFHQNLVSKSTFGMDMIITSSLSIVFESTGKPKSFIEPTARGIRLVQVQAGETSSSEKQGPGVYSHRFVPLDE